MKKYHFVNLPALMLFIGLAFPSFVTSQTLEDAYLESLPPGLAELVQDRTQTNKANGGSDVQSSYKADTTVDYDEKVLVDLYQQLDELSLRLESSKPSYQLKRFGDNFFNSFQSSFMPINLPNFGSDYILDVGDSLQIQIIGKSGINDEFEIGRDGAINIAEIGKLSLSGKSLAEAEELISFKARDMLLASDVFVTISVIRDIQVFMIGNIAMPGLYTLSGGSGALHAINVAGGINENGSFRRVDIIRGDKIISSIDLYDLIIFGKNVFTDTLRSGDAIKVHPQQFLVPISGAVSSPNLYEIKSGETVAQLIEFAGGQAFNLQIEESILLKTYEENEGKIKKISFAEAQSLILKPRDSLILPFYKNEVFKAKSVKISGEVKRPGEYYIAENTRLSDLVKLAGGYKKEAYLFGASLFRSSAKAKQMEFNNRAYADTINDIIANKSASFDTSIFLEELQSLNAEVKGRLIVDFEINKTQQTPEDIVLMDRDEIYIPSIPSHIYLFGDFREPAILPYNPSSSIEDYVKMVAGHNPQSAKHYIVIDPDGVSHFVGNRLFSSLKNHGLDLYPGSIIYKPREMGKINGLEYAQAISPVLSGLAISLASLNSITKD
ncbi:SLBB domain-containing protein [Gammaproteobacteria bacterium]|nr:SLBB domain-containing protein [Gammaproteobacteria bacterium]